MVETNELDIRAVANSQWDIAKTWWASALGLQVGSLILGCFLVFFDTSSSLITAAFTGALTALSAAAGWRADYLKGVAERLKRVAAEADGFGWPVDGQAWADLLPTVSRVALKRTAKHPNSQGYYASQEPPSAMRVLHNLQESSWWTSCLAKDMAMIMTLVTTVLIIFVIGALITALQHAVSHPTAVGIAKTVISVVVFSVSGGLIRLTTDYYRLWLGAARVETAAFSMQKREGATDVEVIRLLHDYFLLRQSAPLIPTKLWKSRQQFLNEVWRGRVQQRD